MKRRRSRRRRSRQKTRMLTSGSNWPSAPSETEADETDGGEAGENEVPPSFIC